MILFAWIHLRIGNADPYPDQGGQTLPTKKEKSEEISYFQVLDVFFRAEGFSCMDKKIAIYEEQNIGLFQL